MISTTLSSNLEHIYEAVSSARPYAGSALRSLQEQYRLASTYHSNSIEGNSLTLAETRLVLEHGLTVGGKPLAHHIEAANTARAWERLELMASPATPLSELLSHSNYQELHAIVMAGLSEDAGRYRTMNVRIVGSYFSPPDWTRVMQRLDKVNQQAISDLEMWPSLATGTSLSAFLVSAARYHHGFEAVQPFSDGNGRVGRLALNLMCLRVGLPPIIIRVEDRRAYMTGLERANHGDFGPLTRLLAMALQSSLMQYLTVQGNVDQLLALSELAGLPFHNYSADYLSLRARQGVLPACKIEGRWYSSVKALKSYQRERGR